MKKVSKPLIIGGALLGILLVGGGTFFYLRQRKPEEEVRSERKLPEPLVKPPAAEEITYETFETQDGNLSFDYPTTWISTDIDKNLETILPKNFIDKYELRMPLFLTDPRGAQITLSVYRFEKGVDLNAVMDSLEADLAALGSPYNEVSRQTVGETLVVDSTVDAGGITVQVRDILFLAAGEEKNTIYNIGLSAPQSVWGEYEPIFFHIQNSAKLSL